MKGLWRPLLVVASLLGLLTVLLLQSRSPDLAMSSALQTALKDFDLHDARTTRDVLLARAGLLPHYDTLANDRRQLLRAMQDIRAASDGGSTRARLLLRPRVLQLAESVADKLDATERFKSRNALLRNSLLYLVFVGPALSGHEKGQAFAAEMGRLSYAVLRYVQAPDPEVQHQIETALQHIERTPRPPPELPTIIAHGRLIIQVLPEVDTLMAAVVQSRAPADAQSLRGALAGYAIDVESRVRVFQDLLYVVAVLLLAYLVYQFNRLRMNAQALRSSESRFRAISDSAHEAIISVDTDGLIHSWNAGATAMFGVSEALALGKPVWPHLPVAHLRVHRRALRRAFDAADLAALARTRQVKAVRRDNSLVAVEVSLSRWATRDGVFITAILRDLTERRRLEDIARQQELKLIQTNKMTALGTLVAGVAHEINNPTQLILVNSGVLGDAWRDALALLPDPATLPPDTTLGGLPLAEMRRSLPSLTDDIRGAAMRIERIVADLKDFVRPGAAGSHQACDVNEVIGRAIRLLNYLIHRRTSSLVVDLAPSLPAARCDAGQFEQVIVNLLVNALEALPSPERGITITSRCDAGGERLRIVIRDEGIGIPEESLARLCDPFFTTKQASGGTGLGLAITATLLRGMAADLTFESAVNAGTSAIVHLPAAAETATAPESALAASA